MHSFSKVGIVRLSTLYNNIVSTHTLLGDMDHALHFFEKSYHLEPRYALLSSSNEAKNILPTMQNIGCVRRRFCPKKISKFRHLTCECVQ
jgi:hypothetical protein